MKSSNFKVLMQYIKAAKKGNQILGLIICISTWC